MEKIPWFVSWILGNVTWYPRHVSENPGYINL